MNKQEELIDDCAKWRVLVDEMQKIVNDSRYPGTDKGVIYSMVNAKIMQYLRQLTKDEINWE